jgi:hypothetical protein
LQVASTLAGGRCCIKPSESAFRAESLLATTAKPDKILSDGRGVNTKWGWQFAATPIPPLATDVWLDMIYICRASFGLACIIAPPETYKYDEKTVARYEEVLEKRPRLLEEIDKAVLHDAVLNVARVWRNVWMRASKKE